MTVGEMAAQGVEYRTATEADIWDEHAVFVAAEGELEQRHGFGWDAPPPLDALAPTLRHLLRTDGERCFVAEIAGRVVGFTAAFVRGDTWYFGWLFIDPGQQGLGIGRRLLELALDGAPSRRITITGSIQPISNALYARYGLLPTTPVIGFEGSAAIDMPAGLVASEPTPAALAALDLAGYGFDRSADHPYWASHATPTLWLRHGEPVAYSYRWQGGRVGPVCGRDEASAAEALQAELARGGSVRVTLPGTSRSLVRVAIAARLRMDAPFGVLLLSDEVEPPHSLAIGSYGLY
jgi:GNAT superfamily N-acetyltransferase